MVKNISFNDYVNSFVKDGKKGCGYFSNESNNHKNRLVNSLTELHSYNANQSISLLLKDFRLNITNDSFLDIIQAVYDSPSKSCGLTTPLVSEVLAYYYPQQEPIYRNYLTPKVLERLIGVDTKNMKVSEKYVYLRPHLKALFKQLKELMPDSCYILLDIILEKIADDLNIKERTYKLNRVSDSSNITNILKTLNIGHFHTH